MTRRKEIINLLLKEKLSFRELRMHFYCEPEELIEDLEHIKKSVLPKMRLLRDHAFCRDCGFVFKDREKIKTPSKCPVCRSESITEPRFYIK